MAGPSGPKSEMCGSIRQGTDTWQVRVYNRTARRYEYFTVTAAGVLFALSVATEIQRRRGSGGQ